MARPEVSTSRRVLRVAIRVSPGASRTAVGGRHPAAADVLVVRVREAAVDGRATEAALRALADALGVRRGQLTLRAGATSRGKLVEIDGADRTVAERLASLLGPASG